MQQLVMWYVDASQNVSANRKVTYRKKQDIQLTGKQYVANRVTTGNSMLQTV